MNPNRKKLIIALDKQAGDKCRARDKKCLLCRFKNKSGLNMFKIPSRAIEPHHALKSRANSKHRWNLQNLIGVCRNCHTDIHSGNITYAEVVGAMLYNDILSPTELEAIENDHSINKITTADMEDMLNETY